jgi:hypothetical protein
MPNKWISHVKSFASKNGMKYGDALKDPKCKAAYKHGSKMRGGYGDEEEDDYGGGTGMGRSRSMMGGRKKKTKRGGKKKCKGTRRR